MSGEKLVVDLDADAGLLRDYKIALFQPERLLHHEAFGRLVLSRVLLQDEVGNASVQLHAGCSADGRKGIVGYDAESKEFIVNDPGTSHGRQFRHTEELIDRGLQDYPTGHNEPIVVVSKVMIVVQPLTTEIVIHNPSNSL